MCPSLNVGCLGRGPVFILCPVNFLDDRARSAGTPNYGALRFNHGAPRWPAVLKANPQKSLEHQDQKGTPVTRMYACMHPPQIPRRPKQDMHTETPFLSLAHTSGDRVLATTTRTRRRCKNVTWLGR